VQPRCGHPFFWQRAILTTGMSGIELSPNYSNDIVALLAKQDPVRRITIKRGA